MSQDWHLLFSHSAVSVSATPWTAACQASLSFTTGVTLMLHQRFLLIKLVPDEDI